MSGFRRDVVEVFDFLGYYAAWVGSWLPTFRGQRVIPIVKGEAVQLLGPFELLDPWRMESRNVGNQLPTYTVQQSRTAKTRKASFCKM